MKAQKGFLRIVVLGMSKDILVYTQSLSVGVHFDLVQLVKGTNKLTFFESSWLQQWFIHAWMQEGAESDYWLAAGQCQGYRGSL